MQLAGRFGRARPGRASLVVLAFALFLPPVVGAETVVARRRVGNNVEAMTYDPVSDRAYAMDGNDVIAIALNPFDAAVLATVREDDGGISGLGFRKLFDVLRLDPLAREPRGVVYVPTQGRFYFSGLQAQSAAQFFSSDLTGRPQPTLNIKGLGDTSTWAQWEGIAWIPPNAPAHGGTLAAIGHRSDFLAHIFYIRLDGTLEAELVPQTGTPLENYFCGISYWPQQPGTLLLSDCGVTGTYAMDMKTGALVGDPSKPAIVLPEAGDVEGVVVRRDGQVLLSGYETGRLYAFNSGLKRTPGEDRLFVVGLGASVNRLAWNFDTAEFIAMSTTSQHVFAVSYDLSAARTLFDVAVNHELPGVSLSGLSYLGQGQVAICNFLDPRGIDVADLTTGYSLSRLLFLPPDYPDDGTFNPRGVGAFGSDRFLVNARDPNALRVVSRTGTPDSSIYPDGMLPTRFADLPLSAPTHGREAQVFNNGSGPRIFTGAEIYDTAGRLLHVIDATKLGIQNPPPFNGVWLFGNTFATVDGLTSTIIVYTVP
jgi:hypothetical protein